MLAQSNRYTECSLGLTFITLENGSDVLVLRKPMFNVDELDLAECIKMNIENASTVWIKLSDISNFSLYTFIIYAFKGFVDQDSEERDEVFDKLKKGYKKLWAEFEAVARERFPRYDELMYHQKEGCYLGYYRRENIFAFEQGLGKTLTSNALAVILDVKKQLIVTPGAVKWQWPSEMMDWDISMLEISIMDASPKDSIKAPFEKHILINYDLLERNKTALKIKNFDMITLDECHKIKNTDSIRSQSIHDLQKLTQARLCLLSGTPATNTAEDIFSYLKLTSHKYGNKKLFYDKFIEEYKDKTGKTKRRGKNLQFLNYCISNLMIRRRKSILNLPPKNYVKLMFDMDKDIHEEYRNQLYDIVNKSESGQLSKTQTQLSLQSLNILSAKSKVPKLIPMIEGIINKKYIVYVDERLIEGSTTTTIEDKPIEVNGKIVIFCVNTEPINMLAEYFGSRAVVIDGKVKMKERFKIATLFRKSRTINVLIGQTDACGIGLNLVNKQKDKGLVPIHTVLHVNFPLTWAQVEQASDRVHRMGQWYPEGVEILCAFSKGTIDEKLYELIKRKYEDVSTLIEGQKEDINLEEVNFSDIAVSVDDIKDIINTDDTFTTFLTEDIK